jgi:tRNA (cytidine/uridine-2'-O-)-methyltransferase
MFHVVLYQPEIPPNTGNIMRLCANCGCHLHLVEPLGFDLDHRKLRRAGLDYRDWASVKVHRSLDEFVELVKPLRIWAVSTRGRRWYSDVQYKPGDTFLFGPETRGLPAELLETTATRQAVRVPMVPASRSLNLSNAVAVLVFEAWRQMGFEGGS